MRLTKKEYEQFLRVHPRLMYYVATKEGLMPNGATFEEFMELEWREKIPARERIYEHPAYIDEFVEKNPFQLSQEDLEIAIAFKAFKKAQFWVAKSLKNYTIFLDDDYAYGVLALGDPFSTFWHPGNLPLLIETTLLPYKDKIVYDGIMTGSNVFFGRSIRSSVNLKYKEAKAKYGIITSLPIPDSLAKKSFSVEEQLKLYMKTAASREQYEFEIEDLLEEHPQLNRLYIQLWGKISARAKKKRLKELGVQGYYFAIYFDTIIASSTSRQQLQKNLADMTKENLKAIHIFKV